MNIDINKNVNLVNNKIMFNIKTINVLIYRQINLMQ